MFVLLYCLAVLINLVPSGEVCQCYFALEIHKNGVLKNYKARNTDYRSVLSFRQNPSQMVTLTTTSATRRLEMALGATKVGEKARNFVFDHV